MSRYILAGFENEELEQAIKEHETFPLVRELCFNFNLRVLCEAELGGTRFVVLVPDTTTQVRCRGSESVREEVR